MMIMMMMMMMMMIHHNSNILHITDCYSFFLFCSYRAAIGDSGALSHGYSSISETESLIPFESERVIVCFKIANYRLPGPSTDGIDPSARPIDWIQVSADVSRCKQMQALI